MDLYDHALFLKNKVHNLFNLFDLMLDYNSFLIEDVIQQYFLSVTGELCFISSRFFQLFLMYH